MLKWQALRVVSGGLLLSVSGCGMDGGDVDESITEARANLVPGGNDYGVAETFHTSGAIDFTNPFFAALGTNPRTCMTCHNPNQGWTMTSEANKQLFKDTDGLDPLFNLVDEGIAPNADISTKKARKATFIPNVVDLAVTRFTRNISATAQYTVAPEDPSGFSTPTSILNFHRPTATANEQLVSSITNTSAPTQDIQVTLANLMRGAAGLHEQRDLVANPMDVATQNAGRDFMFG